MTKTQLDAERKHHAWLDKIAGKCSARTEANETHAGCEYCAHLAVYYNDPRVQLQPSTHAARNEAARILRARKVEP